MRSIGKQVGDDMYIHVSALDGLADHDQRSHIRAAIAALPPEADGRVNVAKINLRTARVSLLEYPGFDNDAFPTLANSWSMRNGPGGTLVLRSYADSLNPPVLHRKELLVGVAHPAHARWAKITQAAESLGLFEQPATIGFQLNWQRAIAAKGYAFVGDEFLPLGNAVEPATGGQGGGIVPTVARHLTALARTAISAPVQLLLRHGLLTAARTFFDYGCGRGDDVSSLAAEGFAATGWDPHYAPDRECVKAEVVNVGFVINVIEDPAERVEVLNRAFGLTQGVMAVAVMLYTQGSQGKQFNDGLVTTRGTFQKYFQQAELKGLLEEVLHQEAFLVGPGIAFVFADKDWEQRFLASRYRRSEVGTRLMQLRARVPARSRERPGTHTKPIEVEAAPIHPLLVDLWRLTLDLGRHPEDVEVPALEEVVQEFGSYSRALRRLERLFDQSLLDRARAVRAEDLRLYFAIQHFSKRARYRQLEPRLQRDVKAFFGDYSRAQAAGLRLLSEAADPSLLLQACHQATEQGCGFLDGDHDLQLHASLVERLPSVLRAYVACGLQLYGDLTDIDLVKIHIGSGKLTLMQFADFCCDPLPRMKRRIKLNIGHATQEVFEYGGQYPMPLLYNKSRYLNEEMPGYAQQLAFDEALVATGLLRSGGFGPAAEELATGLLRRRLEIVGDALVRARSLPDLDEPCGANFTFRQFVECGDTQARLSLPNVPANPESFNALHDLAIKLLDPIIEYFGAIRLTYGFCSQSLAKHIHCRVAPELDQHAAHETKRNGQSICPRGGAACDFVIEDEDMRQVADWVVAHLPFDRLYFYGRDRPIHVSYAPTEAGEAFAMVAGSSGRFVPRRYVTLEATNR
jgi:DNA phosphorothioation-associated putative methyltransferase